MSYPTTPDGGAIVPIVSVAESPSGHVAIPVYRYAVQPADNEVRGDAPLRVYYITAGDLVENGGQYTLEGRGAALPVIESFDPVVQGNTPIAVFVVN